MDIGISHQPFYACTRNWTPGRGRSPATRKAPCRPSPGPAPARHAAFNSGPSICCSWDSAATGELALCTFGRDAASELQRRFVLHQGVRRYIRPRLGHSLQVWMAGRGSHGGRGRPLFRPHLRRADRPHGAGRSGPAFDCRIGELLHAIPGPAPRRGNGGLRPHAGVGRTRAAGRRGVETGRGVPAPRQRGHTCRTCARRAHTGPGPPPQGASHHNRL